MRGVTQATASALLPLYPNAYTVPGKENQMLGRDFLLLTLLMAGSPAVTYGRVLNGTRQIQP
jgi:hypothetical protein